MSDPDNQVISSKFVKEIAKLNGKINNFVTKSTEKAIKKNMIKKIIVVLFFSLFINNSYSEENIMILKLKDGDVHY